MLPWQMWAIAALILMLMELFGAHFVLLGLGLAAAVVAIVAAMAPGVGLIGQILIFLVAALAIIPAIVIVHRRFYPSRGVSVMNEPGGEAAKPREVIVRNGRAGVEIYGDFYPAEFPNSGLAPEPGTTVVVSSFRGITALVKEVST